MGGGGGEVAGAGGGMAGGWQGPLPPVCSSSTVPKDTVQLNLIGPNGMPVEAPVNAAVTVVSVESCAATACPSSGWPSPQLTTAASKIVLADASQQQWTLYLRNASMPSNIIEVGGAFDLVVDASVNSTFYRTIDQTVVLARGGNLIVFAANLQTFYSLPLPKLGAFGIGITDVGKLCGTGGFGPCYPEPHAARISVDGDSAVLAGAQTQTIGWLSFSIGLFTVQASQGGCDGKSPTVMAGFRQ